MNPARLRYWALAAVIVAGAACAGRVVSQPSPPEDRGSCPEIQPIENPPKGSDDYPARELAKTFDYSIGEARAILRLQPRVSELGAALREAPVAGYDDLFITYKPCYGIVIRLTEGEDQEVLATIRELGFRDLLPYVGFLHVTYSTAELSAAQEALDSVLGDQMTYSDIDITEEKVIIGVAREEDIQIARERLEAAIAQGTIKLPETAFTFEVGTPEPQ